MIGDAAARLFADHVTAALLEAAERGIWPAALWAAIERVALTKALVPEEAGGFGVPVAEALLMLRAAGAACLPVPLAETIQASWLLAGAGLGVPDGPLSIADGPDLVLRREGADRWRLTGRAAHVAWGRDAAAIAVLAVRDGQAFIALLPGGEAAVEPGCNLAGEPRDGLSFDCLLPAADVAPAASGIGPTEVRAAGAAMRSQMMAGALQRICDLTVQYAQDRQQFGKPIGRFQAVQQQLAVLASEAAAASAASDLAADGFARGLVLPSIAVGKARVGEAAGIGAAIAHQVHGAIGFTREHRLHFLTRRLWSWRDEYGSEAEWTEMLGHYAAAAGADRLWFAITEL